MLILTRREGEALVVGEQVVVTVLAVKGGQVKIGIEAPPEILVLREELVEHESAPRKGPASSDVQA